VVVRLASGDRPASQQVTQTMLDKIIEESAPSDGVATLMIEQRLRFELRTPRHVAVLVEAVRGGMKVTISPAEASAAAPAPSVSAPVAPAPVAMPIAPPQVAAPIAAPPLAAPVAVPVVAAPAAPAPSAPSAIAVGTDTAGMDKLLLEMKKMGASDLHMSCTMPPLVRLHGEMKPIPGEPPLTPERMIQLLYPICPDKNRREFEERSDTDFAYAIPKVSRFRANMFRDRHGPGGVFRAIPFQLLSAEQLGLPNKVLDLCYLTKGLVVVTGPTGSGKSTTLSTLVNYINEHRSDHIITIEDPIEFVHENKKCLVNQREVHVHTRSFKDALRAALREDPDIVLVGEMRDLETIAIAVETAETGHLVFGTLHTTTAPSTVDRIIDQFPSDRQAQIRQMLAESLRGVIAQTLCKKIGGGRIAAYEILIGNSAVSNLIRNAKTFQLFSLMQTSRHMGMVTLNDSLLEHVKTGKVEPLEAYMKAVQKAEMKGALGKLGHELNIQEEKE
jgi:twitching motility protein PilT